MREPLLHTRRDFLRTSLLGGALSYTVPSFVSQTFAALAAQAEGSLTQIATGRDHPILVLIQLAGGNDGLNAVIPYTNDYYYKARPTLGIPRDQVLPLSDLLGLNPGLVGFKRLFDAGQLAVINGVGYPNPNRSHFRATEIWQTASDADRYLSEGWLGRYFDNACAGSDPTVGVNIGPRLPQAFSARRPKGVSLENPESYRFVGAGAAGNSEELAYRGMNAAGTEEALASSGGSISMVSGTTTLQNGQSTIDFLERTSLDAQVSSDKIREIAGRVKNLGTYPVTGLANNLRLVARLIGGGLPSRIFYVSQGGYDTHTAQRRSHDGRLKDLGDAVSSFTNDLKLLGASDRVLIMTFSEFGRRVHENGSQGTDHGAAAPMFVIGPKVKAGLLGAEPSLAPGDLVDGDIGYNTDFRSVYAGVLEHWLRTPSLPILGRPFAPLGVV